MNADDAELVPMAIKAGHRIARRRGLSHWDGQDITGDALLSAVKADIQLEPAQWRAWLITTANRISCDKIRCRKKHVVIDPQTVECKLLQKPKNQTVLADALSRLAREDAESVPVTGLEAEEEETARTNRIARIRNELVRTLQTVFNAKPELLAILLLVSLVGLGVRDVSKVLGLGKTQCNGLYDELRELLVQEHLQSARTALRED